MKKLWLASALLALAGCSIFKPEFTPPAADRPQVSVVDGKLVVSPEPLRFRVGRGEARIVWQLPASSEFRFDQKSGIVIEGRVAKALPKLEQPPREGTETIVIDRNQDQLVECRAEADALAFSCLNRNTRAGTFLYTVRVRDRGGKLLPILDPSVINEL